MSVIELSCNCFSEMRWHLSRVMRKPNNVAVHHETTQTSLGISSSWSQSSLCAWWKPGSLVSTERTTHALTILGGCTGWSESSLCAWWKLVSLVFNWVHNGGSDQTGRMYRLIWVIAVCTMKAWVLSFSWAHNGDSDQTGRMHRLIWVIAFHTLTYGMAHMKYIDLVVLLCKHRKWYFLV